jgi:hypothetical protein
MLFTKINSHSFVKKILILNFGNNYASISISVDFLLNNPAPH